MEISCISIQTHNPTHISFDVMNSNAKLFTKYGYIGFDGYLIPPGYVRFE